MNAMNAPPSKLRRRFSRFVSALPVPALEQVREWYHGRKQLRAVLDQLARQKAVDASLRAHLQAGGHPLEEPLVIVDPYGDSPLTAVVLFETPGPTMASVRVLPPDGGGTAVEHTFAGYRVTHLLPVYGLCAGVENAVEITVTDEDGNDQKSRLSIRTAPLHPGLSDIAIEILSDVPANSQQGFNFLYRSHPKFAFDAQGRIRWALDLPTNMGTLYEFGGRPIATSGIYLGASLIYEVDLLGRLYSISSTPYGAHHDLEEMPGGKLIVTGSRMRPTIKDLLYELDPATGAISHVMDLKSILDPGRACNGSTKKDWLHMNAVVWSDSDRSIIVSGRNQSAVVKLSYPDGAIRWIMSDHDGWGRKYADYLLTPTGDRFEWPHCQHTPVILKGQSGDPDEVDLLVFDNHSYLQKRSVEAASETTYSRLVQLRINERARTVEQVREWGRERGRDLFTHHCGSIDRLTNGNTLGYFNLSVGHRIGSARIIELDDRWENVVFDAAIYSRKGESFTDYRCTRRGLYSASDDEFWRLEPCREHLRRMAPPVRHVPGKHSLPAGRDR